MGRGRSVGWDQCRGPERSRGPGDDQDERTCESGEDASVGPELGSLSAPFSSREAHRSKESSTDQGESDRYERGAPQHGGIGRAKERESETRTGDRGDHVDRYLASTAATSHTVNHR
jgi:hypothetical protein